MNVRELNETHDPSLRSWVASANVAATDFPVQNLPFGVFRRIGQDEPFRGGVAIGDAVLDLAALFEARLFWSDARDALAAAARSPLNGFMSLGHAASHALRVALSRALREDSPVREQLAPMLIARTACELALPAAIGDYTDFYSSIYHATAVGKLFRPDEPLLPNYRWMPIAYHGRASSVVVSGTPIAWPSGQRRVSGRAEPLVGPSQRLDYEAELGIVIGRGNELGVPIPLATAEEHIFGLCILNDWSARDIQSWEYQPLGPFLGKNFATTISPWIVTLEALAPFRVPWTIPSEPRVLDYLDHAATASRAALGIEISAELETRTMREERRAGIELARASYADAYWTPAQLVAHHTLAGCNLRPGDLLGTGTLSGPSSAKAGSLLELSDGGKRDVAIGALETRRFLEPGDRVSMRARASDGNAVAIGFGIASGVVDRRS